MRTEIMTIFTRTPLHVGCGSSVGVVDQPVVRERHTGFPVIPGSAIKGVLADLWVDENFKRSVDGKYLFGEDDCNENAKAGRIAFGEAKLLAFPVRSAKGCFALITSPLCLARYARSAGIKDEIPPVASGACLAGADVVFDGNNVVLEEYRLSVTGKFPEAWSRILTELQADVVLKGSATRLVLVADEDMQFFAQNACQVSQHVSIDPETGTAKGGHLFNQEEVPAETLFYATLTALRNDNDLIEIHNKVGELTLVQFGAKETTGIGYCTVTLR